MQRVEICHNAIALRASLVVHCIGREPRVQDRMELCTL